MLLGIARTYDMLNDVPRAGHFYRRVLGQDAANIEAISCMAANHFYADQPEVALRYYRRLVQMGVRDTELWNNLGLCCFYASQPVAAEILLRNTHFPRSNALHRT